MLCGQSHTKAAAAIRNHLLPGRKTRPLRFQDSFVIQDSIVYPDQYKHSDQNHILVRQFTYYYIMIKLTPFA